MAEPGLSRTPGKLQEGYVCPASVFPNGNSCSNHDLGVNLLSPVGLGNDQQRVVITAGLKAVIKSRPRRSHTPVPERGREPHSTTVVITAVPFRGTSSNHDLGVVLSFWYDYRPMNRVVISHPQGDGITTSA